MTWAPIGSKMLSSAAYYANQCILYLRFRGTGDVHRYFELPAADYQSFLNAESNGRFFRSHLRDQFRRERMGKLRAA